MPTEEEKQNHGSSSCLALPKPSFSEISSDIWSLQRSPESKWLQDQGVERRANFSRGAHAIGRGHGVLAVLTPSHPAPAWEEEYLHIYFISNLNLKGEEAAVSFAAVTHTSLQQGYSEPAAPRL